MKDKSLLFAIYLVTLSALGLLICPQIISKLILAIIVSAVISALLAIKGSGADKPKYVHKEMLVFDIALLVLLSSLFYERWIHSVKLGMLSEKIGISANLILITIIVILCAAAIHAVDRIASFGLRQVKGNHYLQLLFITVLISNIQFLQLQYSSLQSLSYSFYGSIMNFLISIAVLTVLNYVTGVLIFPKYGMILSSAVITVWSIANYYVIAFHGSPLYFSELANMQTAMAVMGGYKFSVNVTVLLTAVFGILEIAAVMTFMDNSVLRKSWKTYVLPAALTVVSVLGIRYHLSAFGAGWSWKDNIRNYGFILSAAKDISVRSEVVTKPDSYDPENLNYDEPEDREEMDYDTDIIVILNETFCDLSFYSDIETDIDYMEAFTSIPNAVFGKTIVPAVGGGTNRSEFELLTSKAMNLLPDSAPFLYLDRDIAGRGIAQYMKALGYHTTAMHCGAATNYSRNIVYPAMGFDEIFLGEESFDYFGSNGSRNWLDADNYRDMIEYYEENRGISQFIYLLTMQNHGGWEQNKDELDTVHILNDYGDLTDDINEYLSSVRLSCEAFKELTEYFADSERRVIICMVGDHAPSFIDQLSANEEHGEMTEEITERAVPYIIWSNRGIRSEHYTDYAGMTDLVPMILDEAGLPLSAFYQTVLNLHDTFPVRCRYGYTMDRSENITMYDSSDDYYSKINDYYNLEYNSLMAADEYREELFVPKQEK